MLLPAPLVDVVELLETDSPPLYDFLLRLYGLLKTVNVGCCRDDDSVTSWDTDRDL